MKKLIMWTKFYLSRCRYINTGGITKKWIIFAVLIVLILTGCSGEEKEDDTQAQSGSYVDFQELKKENEDIFAWLNIPDTGISYPVLQSGDGDDSFYVTHNAAKEKDEHGALHIEAANLKDMCDFNEIIHGSSPEDGTMFAGLESFLDRAYFDEHQYIYVYLDGNALAYCIVAAYVRDDTRLLATYDYSYAYGCQEFIDEIYDGKSMNKNIRQGWESGLSPEHFLVTLSTVSPKYPGKQIVVIGCLVGDGAGNIDRVIDWSVPEY